MSDETKTERLQVSLTPAMRQAVAEVARQLDVSEAQIVRQAVRNYLKERHASFLDAAEAKRA